MPRSHLQHPQTCCSGRLRPAFRRYPPVAPDHDQSEARLLSERPYAAAPGAAAAAAIEAVSAAALAQCGSLPPSVTGNAVLVAVHLDGAAGAPTLLLRTLYPLGVTNAFGHTISTLLPQIHRPAPPLPPARV